MLIGMVMATGQPCTTFSFANGWTCHVASHSMSCASVEVFPTDLYYELRKAEPGERYDKVPFVYPHNSDAQIIEVLTRVAAWEDEPHKAAVIASADAMLSKVVSDRKGKN